MLAQISVVMNSRPLLPISDDPDDLDCLTPNHLLNGGPAMTVLGARHVEKPGSVRDRFVLIQNLMQGFWKRWSEEYMRTLQNRDKWRKITRDLKIGDLVLVVEENIAPAFWTMARVKQVESGADGLVRTAYLTIAGKREPIKRCIQKLILLPTEEDEF